MENKEDFIKTIMNNYYNNQYKIIEYKNQNIQDNEILAEFNIKTKIFNWSYNKYDSKLTFETRNLLTYAAKIDDNNYQGNIIKKTLINQNIKIKEDINIKFIIGLCVYLLKDKINCIFTNKKNNIITYYLIKKSIY